MTQVDDDRILRLNRQRLFSLTDRLELSYDADKMNVSVFNNLRWNRHRVMSRASVAYALFKNKCELSLSASDIFNQKRTLASTYNAYERTETWYDSFSRYIALSFSYRFDAKAKK